MAFLLTGFAGMNNTERGTALNLTYTHAFLRFLHGMSTLISNLVRLLGPKVALFSLPLSFWQVIPVPWNSLSMQMTLSKSCTIFNILLECL